LLLLGGICLAVGYVFFSGARFRSLGRSPTGLWEFTANLTARKSYRLIIYAPAEWNIPWAEVPDRDQMPVNMTITSPNGDVTKLEADFWGFAPQGNYRNGATDIVGIKYFNVSSALDVALNLASIRFGVTISGLYTVRFLKEGVLVTYGDPGSMEFFEEVHLTIEAYNASVVSGGMLCLIGCVVSLWGVFGKGKVRHTGKRK
jgi:hypothetical protein